MTGAERIRKSLLAVLRGEHLDAVHPDVPRRKHTDPKSASLAVEIAGLHYPVPIDSTLPQVTKYEKDIVQLRKSTQAQQQVEEFVRLEAKHRSDTWKQLILDQGPWYQVGDSLPPDGAPALPVPVTTSDTEILAAFFEHISEGGDHTLPDLRAPNSKHVAGSSGVSALRQAIMYLTNLMIFRKMTPRL